MAVHPPTALCPNIFQLRGPQHAEHLSINNKTGYCVWSLYYAVLRISNPDKSPEEAYVYLTTHPGIFFEIRRFRCYVLEVALAEFKQGRFHGHEAEDIEATLEIYSSQLNECKT